MANFEALAMKGYCINIDLKPMSKIMDKAHRTLFEKEWERVINLEGMSKEYSGLEFLKGFESGTSDDYKFDEKHYTEYMKRYFSGIGRNTFENGIRKIIQQNK